MLDWVSAFETVGDKSGGEAMESVRIRSGYEAACEGRRALTIFTGRVPIISKHEGKKARMTLFKIVDIYISVGDTRRRTEVTIVC